jgi:branched-chain amino acid transport system permease protein
MGVPLMRTKLAAYAVGAIAGGLGGAAYAVDLGTVLPDKFAFSISIILLCMVVLGGMGNVWGVMIGALLVSWINISFLPELNRTVTDVSGKDLHLESHSFLIFGAVLVLMMLFRREGLVPETRTKLVLREPGRTEVESVGADMEQSELDVDVPPERPATTGGKV